MLTSAGLERTQPAARLDAMLRFHPSVEAVHEEETSLDRLQGIRQSILVGLALYNSYNLTDFVLIPDYAWAAFAVRLLLVTPAALLFYRYIASVPASLREILLAAIVLAAFLVPLILLVVSKAPLAPYTANELPLILVFANMILPLRFRHAVWFTLGCLLLTLVALSIKADLAFGLGSALALQVATGCTLSLYANWRTERARCGLFLDALTARIRSLEADASRQRYEDLSLTDALTGLPNRRALDLMLDRCFEEDGALAILMIDVDRFKLFNDAYGHPTGDDCLRILASALRSIADRPGTFVGRFGGEEFIIVARGLDVAQSEEFARRACTAIAGLEVPHPARLDGLAVVTVSIGVASVPSTTRVRRDLHLKAADDALYLAKRRGRNGWAAAHAAAGAGR